MYLFNVKTFFMKQNNAKKLSLGKQTIGKLDAAAMRQVNGGKSLLIPTSRCIPTGFPTGTATCTVYSFACPL
jgi:hypothetical protein